ncbi:MAG TPA: tryptophan synthase subunit alpha [Candidatus Binataceae bacterium]|jgi:tryptophan synthase alpha chain
MRTDGNKSGRIAQKFAELKARGEAALIPFVVAGDPDLDHTKMLVRELESAGADLIELGVPFSDPMADGPANQRALARGLAAGATLRAILSTVKELRAETQIPIILFGYYNPILHYGCERLCADAAAAGVDGLLVVDLPLEESAELDRPARASRLDPIRLLAPTTPLDRSRRIARSASGFLYYVSVAGVTGARDRVGDDVEQHVRDLKSITKLPIAVGFGISQAEHAAQVAKFADGVVVGSKLSLLIEEYGKSAPMVASVKGLIRDMKSAMRKARLTDNPAAGAGWGS